MKTLSSLDLRVPSLGIQSTKNLFGGYYGGYINPSYCIGYTNDSDYFSFFLWLWSQAEYIQERDDSAGGSGGVCLGGDSYWDDNQDNHGYYFDPSMTSGDRAIITNAMEALPEELQNQNVKIVVDPDLIALLDEANGCFLHEGFKKSLGDGTFLEINEDTIVLRSSANIDVLWEESLHQWQYNNCIHAPLSLRISAEIQNAMEIQADIIEVLKTYAQDYKQYGDITVISHFSQIAQDIEVQNMIMDNYNAQYGNYNIQNLVSFFDSYISSPDGYEFEWEYVLSMFFGQTQTGTQFNGGRLY